MARWLLSLISNLEVDVVKKRIIQSDNYSNCGITKDEYALLKVQYPSAVVVKQYAFPNGNLGVIQLNMIGRHSYLSRKKITYQLILDFREFPHKIPECFVRSPNCSQIRHSNIHHGGYHSIAPNIELCPICIGGFSSVFDSLPKDRTRRFNGIIHQLQSVLSNPNPRDSARSG